MAEERVNQRSSLRARAAASACVFAACVAGLALETYKGPGQTWHETLQFAALFFLTLGAIVWSRRPGALAESAAGRIVLAGVTVCAALTLYPSFHLLATGQSSGGSRAAKAAPIVACMLLWILSLLLPGAALSRNETAGAPPPADRLETFLKRPGARVNLFVLALLGLPLLTWMSGAPIRSAAWSIAFAGALLLVLRGLLRFAETVLGAWMLSAFVMASCGAAAWQGFGTYFELRDEATKAVASMEGGRPVDAKEAYDKALALTRIVRTNGPRIEMETRMAREYEKQNKPAPALAHWENVALLTKVDASKFLPIRRVKCALGDSLPPWRMLVFEGFPAIEDPEMAPGIMRLADSAPDVRAKLLAALLAWEQMASEAERRKLLEAVQTVAPGEPSSLNLLKRLGAPVKDVPMWLPPALIVGEADKRDKYGNYVPTYQSPEGTVEELGEVYTIVCLNTGHWEMSLFVAGTPLHEEWPVVRVEMNGQLLATTQINKAEKHDVPFTFDVTRNDIFKVRIVFQNREDDLEEGRATRRGLKIEGIRFSHAK